MEIDRDDILHFLKSWIKDYKIDLSVENVFDLIHLVNECFDDKMMFDSWFRGLNVMD